MTSCYHSSKTNNVTQLTSYMFIIECIRTVVLCGRWPLTYAHQRPHH